MSPSHYPASTQEIHEGPEPLRNFLEGGKHREYRWWKPLVSIVLASVIVVGATAGANLLFGWLFPELPTDIRNAQNGNGISPVVFFLSMLPFLIAFLALFFSVRYVEGRRPGSLSSVKGHLRWGILFPSLILGVCIMTPVIAINLLFHEVQPLTSGLWAVIVLNLLLTPFQAAIEEYVFRGWMQQTFRGWGMPIWLVVVLSTVIFTLGHMRSTWIEYVPIVVFGLFAALLTLRTAGLEAAIGVHVAANVVGNAASVLLGPDPMTNGWVQVSIAAAFLIYALIADWWFRRVLTEENGPEEMTGPLGGPKGNFGAVSALKRREVA